ncbi:helix-turn-helix domain-containing protein [Cnuibacter physcomitrellae]|uniref:IclR family transcriptional regulator domain-containing protein n=1 Tax=Cnuibacter physcomitrellae TaxID=1619308 RepID=UPI002175FCCF|nr:IclR family transcriptional regulator C-terminal domain-containing protein [Cnuibacter physcomitrellae]MCS5498225.1 helix-turn-helix domain-containing protein [Cnuibacter physcomitrellae]
MSADEGGLDEADAEPPGGPFVQSLARGLSVIASFGATRPVMTLTEVAEATGLSRATARRFLHTLADLGYVRSDGREFALTARVLELGYSYLAGLGLPEIAQPHLERLSHELGESSSASVLDGDDIVYVARVPTRRIMAVTITLGTRFPAAITSMGRVLLAALSDRDLAAHAAVHTAPRLTPDTITRPDDLMAEIGRVRAQGYSLVDQELESGLRSVAVPVSRRGAVVAAVNVSTSVSTSVERLRDEFVPALRVTAAAITADLDLALGL